MFGIAVLRSVRGRRVDMKIGWRARKTHVDDVQRLAHRGLLVEREAGVDLGADLARHDLEDLLAELDEQAVEGVVDLVVDALALLLAVLDRLVDQLGVLGLLGGGEDERGVGGGILRLVLVDGCTIRLAARCFECRGIGGEQLRGSQMADWLRTGKVARVADDGGAGGLELVKRGRHIAG